MTRFFFFVLLFALSAAAAPPNIIVILTDDQGWGDLSLSGNKDLETPHIDSLARDGASFDRFYVCPVCSPTRAEFLTGRYHARSGVYSTSAGGERMDLDEATIADSFKAAGYATGAFGKWHNGMQYPYHPNGRGFDEYYGFCSGHWGDYFSPPLEHNGRIVQGDGFVIDDFTNKAMDFIDASKDSPFFVYLPYNTPHSPMQVPDRWWDKFKDKPITMPIPAGKKKISIDHYRAALAMCENIDWNVGRLLAHLDSRGIADNTIVAFFHDNGPNGVRWNGGMLGRKGSTDEGGVRTPFLLRWPAKVKPGTVIPQIAGAIDLLPTFASLAGVPVKSTKALDGIDLTALILGEATDWKDRIIINHWKNRFSARNQRFRLGNTGKLFDMLADPGQKENVAKAHPAILKTLSAAVAAHRKSTAGYDQDERSFVIGHPEHQHTQLPARDAQHSGGIARSNKFPNCSFLNSWSETTDEIYFDVEVAAAGNFEIDIHYSCSAADLGSTFEIVSGKNRLTGTVSKAHDPPERGGENDRSPRAESYVKDFASMTVGRLHLDAGKSRLTLRATEIPGSHVMDFRLMMLKRLSE
ncbi:MAG: arylsulfatase A-like enzyme [Rhodothermales bacterium]|jgi:arylsulfatase A-like enzyme